MQNPEHAPEWIKVGDADSVFNQSEQRFYYAHSASAVARVEKFLAENVIQVSRPVKYLVGEIVRILEGR